MNPVERFYRRLLTPYFAILELRKLKVEHGALKNSFYHLLEEYHHLRSKENERLSRDVTSALRHYESSVSLVDREAFPILRIRLQPLGINYSIPFTQGPARLEPEPYRQALRHCAEDLAHHMVAAWFKAGLVEKLEPSPEHDPDRKAIRIRH